MTLVEVEGILNSKPLGYATFDIADPNPITLNLLLYNQYGTSGLLGRCHWKHS